MGKEEKPKGGDKEKEKEKENKGDGGTKNKKKDKKDKKDESPPIIVLRTDLHCKGCAMKVESAIRSLPGVDAVSADAGSNRVTVTGPADPGKVKERIEATIKTIKSEVEFVSPANPPKKDKASKVGVDSPKQPKEPPESTVMLKIRLQREDCIDEIRKGIYEVKGVNEVKVDATKNLFTVKGTMDVNTLPSSLQMKLHRSVEIVPAEKDAGGGSRPILIDQLIETVRTSSYHTYSVVQKKVTEYCEILSRIGVDTSALSMRLRKLFKEAEAIQEVAAYPAYSSAARILKAKEHMDRITKEHTDYDSKKRSLTRTKKKALTLLDQQRQKVEDLERTLAAERAKEAKLKGAIEEFEATEGSHSTTVEFNHLSNLIKDFELHCKEFDL